MCDSDPATRYLKKEFREKLNFSSGPDLENVSILEAALRGSLEYVERRDLALGGFRIFTYKIIGKPVTIFL